MSRSKLKRTALKLGKVLLGAVCLAALIVMAMPPDLPAAPKNYTFAPMINMDMVSATSNRQGAALVYNEEQVNSYVATNLRRKDSPAWLSRRRCLHPAYLIQSALINER